MLATPIAKPVVAKIEGPRLPPSNEDILHAVFIGNIPDDLSDEWMERIARVPSRPAFRRIDLLIV